MSNMTCITAVIITQNEEENIPDLISSLKGVVGEIIVIDSGSTDNTVELAKSRGAKVFYKAWSGYGGNKNYGNQLASNDWILSIDADERISSELALEIPDLVLNVECVYCIGVKSYYCGKWINYTEWHPSPKPRLFNRNLLSWNDSEVHEALEPLHDAKKINLKSCINQLSHKNKEEHLNKNKVYARLGAEKWISSNYEPSFVKRNFGSFFRFFRSYILNLGFLDGKQGYQISKLNADLVKQRVREYDRIKNRS